MPCCPESAPSHKVCVVPGASHGLYATLGWIGRSGNIRPFVPRVRASTVWGNGADAC